MTRQEWIERAERYQAMMDEIGDPDDSGYQLWEIKRDACYSNAADALEPEQAISS